MVESDKEYYARRVAEERAEAREATRNDVRRVHSTLAEMYQARIAALEERESDGERTHPRHLQLVNQEIIAQAH